jgi:hypothetical protein
VTTLQAPRLDPFQKKLLSAFETTVSATGITTIFTTHPKAPHLLLTRNQKFPQRVPTLIAGTIFGSFLHHIQQIDPEFAEALRTDLLGEFGVDCSEPALRPTARQIRKHKGNDSGASWNLQTSIAVALSFANSTVTAEQVIVVKVSDLSS